MLVLFFCSSLRSSPRSFEKERDYSQSSHVFDRSLVWQSWSFDWLIDWLIDWLTDWLIVWLIDWHGLRSWLAYLSHHLCFIFFSLGENKNKSGPNNPADPSLVVVLLIAILVLVVLGLVISLFKKRCPCQTSQDPPRMTRRSTNPDDIHDDDEESLEVTDQTELECEAPDSNNESSNSIGQESGEPSGSMGARGDSSVAVSTIKWLYFLLTTTLFNTSALWICTSA